MVGVEVWGLMEVEEAGLELEGVKENKVVALVEEDALEDCPRRLDIHYPNPGKGQET